MMLWIVRVVGLVCVCVCVCLQWPAVRRSCLEPRDLPSRSLVRTVRTLGRQTVARGPVVHVPRHCIHTYIHTSSPQIPYSAVTCRPHHDCGATIGYRPTLLHDRRVLYLGLQPTYQSLLVNTWTKFSHTMCDIHLDYFTRSEEGFLVTTLKNLNRNWQNSEYKWRTTVV